MQEKLAVFKTMGMTRDTTESAFRAEFAYENMNIRLSTVDNNTLLSITNERGPLDLDTIFTGTPIGYAVIDNKIVLFTTYYTGLTNHSNIYLIDITEGEVTSELMYSGDLNFSVNHPIETLPVYENENAIKVYWVDGINQPRVINIARFYDDKDALRNGTNTQFDFVSTMQLNESCSVTKNSLASGTFSPGTIQYVCTYYNKYGQESNIFYTSSLYYISYSDRAGSPEDRVSNAFNIHLKNLDRNFEYVRIYSIHRTSLDATPTVRRVADLSIQNSSEQEYTYHSSDDVYFEGVDFMNDKFTTSQYNNQQIGYLLSIEAVRNASSTGTDARGKYYRIPLNVIAGGGGNSSFIQFKGNTYYGSSSEALIPWYFKVYYDGDTFASIDDANGNVAIDNDVTGSVYWKELDINNVRSVKYTDDGESGDVVDPTQLLFIGGKALVASTITQKDNTLFLGNIRTEGSLVPEEVTNAVQGDFAGNFNFVNDKPLAEKSSTGIYPYTNHLDKPLSEIATFKYGEWYRFGLQFQRSTGEWTEPVWIGDKQNDKAINNAQDTLGSLTNTLTQAKFNLSSDSIATLRKYYKKVRPVVVYPSPTDRTIICQGVLNPTMFNVADRISNSPFAQSSWFFRPNAPAPVSNYTPTPPTASSKYYLLLVTRKLPSKTNINLIIAKNLYQDGSGIIHSINLNFVGYKYGSSDANIPGWIGLYEMGANLPYCSISDVIRYLEEIRTSSGPDYYYIHLGNYSDQAYVMGYGEAVLTSAVVPSANGELYLDSSYGDTTSKTISNTYTVAHSNQFDHSSDVVWHAEIKSKDTPLDNSGNMLEFRHFHSLPPSNTHSAEIQCNVLSLSNPYLGTKSVPPYQTSASTRQDYRGTFSDLFFVDSSIVTFHSPDIEFDTNLRGLNQEGLKLRIVGYVPITGTVSDLDIRTSTPALNYRADISNGGSLRTVAEGFYKETVGVLNTSASGYLGLVTKNAWLDEMFSSNENNYNKKHWTFGFPVYPWHRKGSMNNQSYNSVSPDANNKSNETPTDYRSAKLKSKKMSNLRFSLKPVYINTDLNDAALQDYQYSMAGLQVFDSDQQTNLRLLSPNGKDTINYYGNIDKLITNMTQWKVEDDTLSLGTTDTGTNLSGYPLAATSSHKPDGQHLMFNDNISYLHKLNPSGIGKIIDNWKDVISIDPIHMRYKSSIHAVLSLKGSSSGSSTTLNILPTCTGLNKQTDSGTPFYDSTTYYLSQKEYNIVPGYGWLWLADIVREDVVNRFGGYDAEGKPTKEAIESNNWIPCGPDVSLSTSSVQVVWNEGDTFFQRYDCLKTYPFSLEDTNSVVDILSFMCETRINLDGRYDKNRGQSNNLTMMPSNFNLLNEVYSQRNNFFNYRILDSDLFDFETYPYTVTWTKTKNNGEKVDIWTNLTMASTLDLDGDKGEITALRRINDSIIAFQTKGVSQILYNEQMQLSTTEGVPIEIANSGKVTGKKYLSDRIGCLNKWSICQTPAGIYFIDDYGKSLQLLTSEGLTSLSDTQGFHSWMLGHYSTDVWNPSEFNNVITHYDETNQDVLFVNKDWCLAFSEGMGRFSSFYNYEGTPYFINLKGKGYWIRKKSPVFKVDLNIWDPRPSVTNTIINNPLKYPEFVSTGNKQWSASQVKGLYQLGAIKSPVIAVPMSSTPVNPGLSDAVDTILPNLSFDTPYCELWQHNAGDYNYFFGKYKPYWTTVVINGDSYYDKIFNTVDFRSDSWDGTELSRNTFDRLEVWNEYQSGVANLHNNTTALKRLNYPSNLKQKFRVWRAQIPRDSANRRDRMRNPWLYLKLSRTIPNTERMVLHDISVHYFE